MNEFSPLRGLEKKWIKDGYSYEQFHIPNAGNQQRIIFKTKVPKSLYSNSKHEKGVLVEYIKEYTTFPAPDKTYSTYPIGTLRILPQVWADQLETEGYIKKINLENLHEWTTGKYFEKW